MQRRQCQGLGVVTPSTSGRRSSSLKATQFKEDQRWCPEFLHRLSLWCACQWLGWVTSMPSCWPTTRRGLSSLTTTTSGELSQTHHLHLSRLWTWCDRFQLLSLHFEIHEKEETALIFNNCSHRSFFRLWLAAFSLALFVFLTILKIWSSIRVCIHVSKV